MIKADLQKKIEGICILLGIERKVTLEHPQELTHGDFATSIALSAAKDLKQNPKELAEIIAGKIRELGDESIKDVSVAGPGFINIALTQKALLEELSRVLEGSEKYGQNKLHQGKKILVEHSSPNLFKPFHIGHLMNNAIGEAITRIIKNTEADTTVISYPSDISLGIAKAIRYVIQNGGEDWVKKTRGVDDIQNFIAYAGPAYVEGTKAYEESEQVQKEVREIANKLYKRESGSELTIFESCKELNLRYFDLITQRLGSNFDGFIFESETGPIGKNLVQENVPRVFTESEGAVIYEGEKQGLHTRVFINKDGNPTYEAKDLGLLSLKFERYSPDVSIFVTDHEQGPYFKVVASAAGEINKDWQDKTVHLTHGRMTFKGAKMSSRLGGIPTAEEVLNTIKEVAKEKFTERSVGMDIDVFADMVAIAALKFSILKVAPGKPVNFDPEEALSFEGDSGPYIQYTYVRTRALLEKGAAVNIFPQVAEKYVVSDVERILYRFEEVALLSAQEYAPHHIAHYLLEVAQAFNSWYAQEKVIDENNTELSAHRLAIASAVGTVVKNGLNLLGIETPERM
ncbi:MAG: arginine--tRNA ligase [Minisyncoccia bacterium]